MNATIEIIHKALGNLVNTYNLQETCVDDADQWMGILAAAAFAVKSTHHRTKQKILVQLVLGQNMILPINRIANWKYIHQQKQAKI